MLLLPSFPQTMRIHAQCDFRNPAPWSLNRISTSGSLPDISKGHNYSYSYDPRAGEGVDVYVFGVIVIIVFSLL